jgi:hypothetical protein
MESKKYETSGVTDISAEECWNWAMETGLDEDSGESRIIIMVPRGAKEKVLFLNDREILPWELAGAIVAGFWIDRGVVEIQPDQEDLKPGVSMESARATGEAALTESVRLMAKSDRSGEGNETELSEKIYAKLSMFLDDRNKQDEVFDSLISATGIILNQSAFVLGEVAEQLKQRGEATESEITDMIKEAHHRDCKRNAYGVAATALTRYLYGDEVAEIVLVGPGEEEPLGPSSRCVFRSAGKNTHQEDAEERWEVFRSQRFKRKRKRVASEVTELIRNAGELQPEDETVIRTFYELHRELDDFTGQTLKDGDPACRDHALLLVRAALASRLAQTELVGEKPANPTANIGVVGDFVAYTNSVAEASREVSLARIEAQRFVTDNANTIQLIAEWLLINREIDQSAFEDLVHFTDPETTTLTYRN